MGTGVGVHKEDEVKHLKPEEREKLKDEITKQLQQLYSSKDISEIPSDKDLESFMQKNPDIRKKVADLVKPTYDRYQKR
jgi:hypothetical protein